MQRKRPLTSRGVKRMVERERSVGLDPEDETAKWLAENDVPPPAPAPKSASKSRELHRWRRRQGS